MIESKPDTLFDQVQQELPFEQVQEPQPLADALARVQARMEATFQKAKAAGVLTGYEDTLCVVPVEGGGKDVFGHGDRCKPGPGNMLGLPAEKRKRMLRVQSDGTPSGTKVFVGDIEIAMVQNVCWEVDADGPDLPVIRFTAIVDKLEIVTKQEARI